MAGSVNKVILLGHLGRIPEVRTFSNGGKVCNLNIATTETWKDRATGKKRERTEWHRVAIMVEGLVGVAEKYLRKGSKVYLEGQLETRKWQDQSGQDRYSTEVVLRPFSSALVLLGDSGGGRGDQSGSYGDQGRGGYDQGGGSQGGTQGGQTGGTQGRGVEDDEIPF